MEILYALFGLSVFFPIFTYVIYPIILFLTREKSFQRERWFPTVSVIIWGTVELANGKIANIKECNYPGLEIIVSEGINDSVCKANGEVLIFTDTETEFDKNAIHEIIKPLFDRRIGAVVGMQCAKSKKSAFWKYENKIRALESKTGNVSGANHSIFAVRKSEMPIVTERVKNKMFYIATSIIQAGNDVVYEPKAIAYEVFAAGTNFDKHLKEAIGYWQALFLFPKMLFPRKGCFIYVSHRVMKWFAPFNILFAYFISGALAGTSLIMFVAFACQTLVYLCVLLFGKSKRACLFIKLLSILRYFIELNIAYLLGFGIYFLKKDEG